MPRLRLFDPGDPTEFVGWRIPALIIATLFVNVPFWFTQGDDFWRLNSPLLATAAWSAAALLCAILFFLGPALNAQAANSFPAMLASTFGRVPGTCVQIVCAIYVVIWISSLLAMTSFWLEPRNHPWTPLETAAISAAVLTVAALTAWQSIRTTAVLARFSIHLGTAILIAALIRARSGWPAIPHGFETVLQRSLPVDLWWGFSYLSYAVAPLALLAAAFVRRCATRKSVVIVATLGIVVPLAGSMVIATAVSVATHASSLYRPSGHANIAMALTSGVTRQHERAVLIIFALTIIGLLRFGAAALKNVAGGFHWLRFGCLFSAIVWCSAHADRPAIAFMFDATTQTLAAACAVLTVDAIMRRKPPAWSATLALLCGIAIPAFCRFWWPDLNEDAWRYGWLLPSYGIAFLSTVLLRLLPVAR